MGELVANVTVPLKPSFVIDRAGVYFIASKTIWLKSDAVGNNGEKLMLYAACILFAFITNIFVYSELHRQQL